MTFWRQMALAGFVFGLLLLAGGSADAAGPGFGFGGGCGGGGGFGGLGYGGYGLFNNGFSYNSPPYPWPFYQHSIPTPPYFSLHPPVYYSQPVARTYGYSPYPYPGAYPTPDVEVAKPEVIQNPHAEPLPKPAEPPKE